MTTSLAVFGDSHAGMFFCTDTQLRRTGFEGKLPHIHGEAISAASLAGFRKKKSTLDAKQKVAAAMGVQDRVVLGFGQVDLELGYYYRNAVKGETVDPMAFVDWLSDIYSQFLDDIETKGTEIAIKGVNLTVFRDQEFFFSYVSRIVAGRSEEESLARRLREVMLDETSQNDMHLAFNTRLADLARTRGMAYFDINQALLDLSAKLDGLSIGETPKLSDVFHNADFDHHLVDSLAVRRIHLEALQNLISCGKE